MLKYLLISIIYIIGVVITYIADGYLEFGTIRYKEDRKYWLPERGWIAYKAGDIDNQIGLMFACLFWFVFWLIYLPYKLAIFGNVKLHPLREKKLEEDNRKLLLEQKQEKERIRIEAELLKIEAEINAQLNEVKEENYETKH